MAQWMAADPGEAASHSVLASSFPVVLPADPALLLPEPDFHAWLRATVPAGRSRPPPPAQPAAPAAPAAPSPPDKAPFVAALERHAAALPAGNRTRTQNLDVAHVSAHDALVDLFHDLRQETGSHALKKLLDRAWAADPLLTVKIIFNARSIHLGKGDQVAAYKAFGWLADAHPLTLLANLPWLVRPVIQKKKPPAEQGKGDGAAQVHSVDEDFDMIDAAEADPRRANDVRFGVSHGYWKDLLNLVVFAANDQLRVDGDPARLLNTKKAGTYRAKTKREWDQAKAKELRRQARKVQHDIVQEKLTGNTFYRALHIVVARLFAEQLREDKALLDSGEKADRRKLSLAAKWAPSFGEFHDKHTFILSSIAEILFPDPAHYSPDPSNRELSLRHARELYRKQYASPLRKALGVVEREIAAKRFEEIKYEQVPSLAMNRYTKLFLSKDYDHFAAYINDVAQGTARISGATLLPSTLVSKARTMARALYSQPSARDVRSIRAAAEARVHRDVVNGQWNTILQRIRDAGTLTSSIAVCDVSGSMSSPVFADHSTPMDSAIGLSLLIAEVTAPPFGGGFITFSERPKYISMGGGSNDPRGLVDQVSFLERAHWGLNTDFVAVFEKIILPMALANQLKPEEMVKQVFVFSDMQFDAAQQYTTHRWTTSYERIKSQYSQAGYEVPRMIFWNLAGTRTDKPTTMEDLNTVLVSGYSQGMLRVFLETGALDGEEGEAEGREVEGEDEMMEIKVEKKGVDALEVVRKAVGHAAYGMLTVVD